MNSVVVGFAFSFAPDGVLNFSLDIRLLNSVLRYGSLNNPIIAARFLVRGAYEMQSDGMYGVTSEGTPVAATVVALQERAGVLFEVARVYAADGSWALSALPSGVTHVLALREGHNAGVSGYIQVGV